MPESIKRSCVKAVAIGCSAGGVEALKIFLGRLPADFPHPVFVTIHRGDCDSRQLTDLLNVLSQVEVSSPDDKEVIQNNHVYVAPGGYHMQIERNFSFSLSVDPPVHNCRPSVDVMFETAAWAYGSGLIGVVLSGANEDGSLGIRQIKAHGGVALVQSPQTARFPEMPEAALRSAPIDHVLRLEEIAAYLTG
jgi:two-component system chemotaxis response regulator CheB